MPMLSLLVGSFLAPVAPTTTARIVAASLFKNGYAVVTREIDVPAGGKALLEDIPQGAMGTVWLTTTEGLQLSKVRNVEVQTVSSEPPASIADFLNLNKGKTVSLQLYSDGKLEGVLMNSTGELVLIKIGESVTALPVSQVRSASVTNGVTSLSKPGSHRALDLEIKGNRAGKLYMIGLEKGLTWSPAYGIDLSDPKQLKFTAKAVLMDDLGDLNNIDVRLVTGFPNVLTVGIPDPLLAAQSMDDYLRSIGMIDASNDARMSRMSMSNNMAMQAAGMAAPPMDLGSMGSPGVPQGDEQGDLFFYKAGQLTLSKGERDYHILADTKLAYKEVYTWDSVDSVLASGEFERSEPNQPVAPDEVWHSLEFTNDVGEPLTTGPVTFFKNGELVGQDMLRYTAPKGSALAKINKALDVQAESADEEVDRKRAALQISGIGQLDLVTLKTTLKVTNRKGEAIHLRITRPFTGDVSDPGDAKVTKNIKGLKSLNASGKLVWERDLPAHKTTTVSFTAQLYVRPSAGRGF